MKDSDILFILFMFVLVTLFTFSVYQCIKPTALEEFYINRCKNPCKPYITLTCNEDYYICADNNEKAIWFKNKK